MRSFKFVVIVIALLPVGVILGLLFQWVARAYVSEQRTLAVAYALECIGGIVGGLAATLLKTGIQNFAIAIGCSLMTACVVAIPRERSIARYAAAVIAVGFVTALFASPWLDRRLTGMNHPYLLDTRDSPYGRITITKRQDQFVVFENDVVAFRPAQLAAQCLCVQTGGGL